MDLFLDAGELDMEDEAEEISDIDTSDPTPVAAVQEEYRAPNRPPPAVGGSGGGKLLKAPHKPPNK